LIKKVLVDEGFQIRILHPLPKASGESLKLFFVAGLSSRFAANSFSASLSFAQKLRLQSRSPRLALPQAAPGVPATRWQRAHCGSNELFFFLAIITNMYYDVG